jgi:putative component of membrane protein insertase Oxa1/YidC/SpoIIIJ protein YidD
MKSIFHLRIVLFCLVIAPALSAFAQDQDPGEDALLREESLFISPITFYQRFISPADGNRCQMTPSCSAYSKESFNAHGFFLGWIMTCDRLMRCGRDETRLSPEILTPGGRLTLDPLSENNSWMK